MDLGWDWMTAWKLMHIIYIQRKWKLRRGLPWPSLNCAKLFFKYKQEMNLVGQSRSCCTQAKIPDLYGPISLFFKLNFNKTHHFFWSIDDIMANARYTPVSFACWHKGLRCASIWMFKPHMTVCQRCYDIIITMLVPSGFLVWSKIKTGDACFFIID